MATRKSTSGKRLMKQASAILDGQKRNWKNIFASSVKNSKNPIEGARKASRKYKSMYGSTAEIRWKNAIKKARQL